MQRVKERTREKESEKRERVNLEAWHDVSFFFSLVSLP